MSCTSCVRHEGVELFEFVRGDVLYHSMQRACFPLSGVEVLIDTEPEQSICHTGLQRPYSEAKVTLHKKSHQNKWEKCVLQFSWKKKTLFNCLNLLLLLVDFYFHLNVNISVTFLYPQKDCSHRVLSLSHLGRSTSSHHCSSALSWTAPQCTVVVHSSWCSLILTVFDVPSLRHFT